MSAIKQFLAAGLTTLQSAWGTDDILVGGQSVRAIWNDSLDSATLQEGGFNADEIASVLIRATELPATVKKGTPVTARGQQYRVHEIRGRSDVAVTLTLIDARSSR